MGEWGLMRVGRLRAGWVGRLIVPLSLWRLSKEESRRSGTAL